jgi:hypothetical protein
LTLLLACLVPFAAACSSTDTSTKKGDETVAGRPSGSLTDPLGGYEDKTPAQRREEWLHPTDESDGTQWPSSPPPAQTARR